MENIVPSSKHQPQATPQTMFPFVTEDKHGPNGEFQVYSVAVRDLRGNPIILRDETLLMAADQGIRRDLQSYHPDDVAELSRITADVLRKATKTSVRAAMQPIIASFKSVDTSGDDATEAKYRLTAEDTLYSRLTKAISAELAHYACIQLVFKLEANLEQRESTMPVIRPVIKPGENGQATENEDTDCGMAPGM
jgi:hypothetical protein